MKLTLLILLLLSANVFSHGKKKHSENSENSDVPKKEIIISDTIKRKLVAINQKINAQYLVDIKPIFKNSCFDCHSDQTKFPWYYKLPIVKQLMDHDINEAKKHMDFSKDYPFQSHETQLDDLAELVEVIEEGEMPMFRYTILHPDSVLSETEIKTVLKWIKESESLIKNLH